MRFYGFGNYYLSSLQQGLQAGHAAVDLHVKYNILERGQFDVQPCRDAYDDWAANHKTMVLLNGGNSADLQELFDFLYCEENPYPFVKFHEDEVSLNGALTYVGMILPPEIYDTSAKMRMIRSYDYNPDRNLLCFYPKVQGADVLLIEEVMLSPFQFALCERLNQYGLAK